MKTKIMISIVFLWMFNFSNAQIETVVDTGFVDEEIEETWKEFIIILEAKDKKGFKEIASQNINCYLCLENTEAEQKELDDMRDSDADWYEKLYHEKIYIPIERFIEEDFDLIFDSRFVSILSTKEADFYETDRNGIKAYEILIVTTEPTAYFDGGQHSFLFIKEDGTYNFAEIGTIP